MIGSFNEIFVTKKEGIFMYPRRKCKVCGGTYFSDDPSQARLSTEHTCTYCTIAFTKGDFSTWGKA